MLPSAWTGAIVIGPAGDRDPGLRQQPAGEQRLGERHRRGEAAGDAQHGEPVGHLRPGAAELVGDPGQRQPGLLQRIPQRLGPLAFLGLVDGVGSQRSWKIRVAVSTMIESGIFPPRGARAIKPEPRRLDKRAPVIARRAERNAAISTGRSTGNEIASLRSQ